MSHVPVAAKCVGPWTGARRELALLCFACSTQGGIRLRQRGRLGVVSCPLRQSSLGTTACERSQPRARGVGMVARYVRKHTSGEL